MATKLEMLYAQTVLTDLAAEFNFQSEYYDKLVVACAQSGDEVGERMYRLAAQSWYSANKITLAFIREEQRKLDRV